MAKTKLLRLSEVIARVGLSKSTLYNRIRAGDFPAGFAIGAHSRRWLESEIEDWLAYQMTNTGPCSVGGRLRSEEPEQEG